MSDIAVITIVKARLTTLLPATPILDTINVRPGTLPAQFLTVKREFSSVDRISIGPSPNTQFRETGTLTIRVTVQSGIGTDTAEALAEQVRDLFHNYAVTQFRVLVVDSPSVIDPDDGNWFQLEVPVQYQYDFFK